MSIPSLCPMFARDWRSPHDGRSPTAPAQWQVSGGSLVFHYHWLHHGDWFLGHSGALDAVVRLRTYAVGEERDVRNSSQVR